VLKEDFEEQVDLQNVQKSTSGIDSLLFYRPPKYRVQGICDSMADLSKLCNMAGGAEFQPAGSNAQFRMGAAAALLIEDEPYDFANVVSAWWCRVLLGGLVFLKNNSDYYLSIGQKGEWMWAGIPLTKRSFRNSGAWLVLDPKQFDTESTKRASVHFSWSHRLRVLKQTTH
jgi:hypothetical protein